jgi:hypothetical protein
LKIYYKKAMVRNWRSTEERGERREERGERREEDKLKNV